jgi:hypothetical protein
LFIDGHRKIGSQSFIIAAQQVLIVSISQQFSVGAIEQPSDVNAQQSVGQVDPVERLVLDMMKPEPLVDRVGLFEAGRHCLTRVQGADKRVGDDGAWNSPELSSPFRIVGTQRLLVGAEVCFQLLAARRHSGMLPSRRCPLLLNAPREDLSGRIG